MHNEATEPRCSIGPATSPVCQCHWSLLGTIQVTLLMKCDLLTHTLTSSASQSEWYKSMTKAQQTAVDNQCIDVTHVTSSTDTVTTRRCSWFNTKYHTHCWPSVTTRTKAVFNVTLCSSVCVSDVASDRESTSSNQTLYHPLIRHHWYLLLSSQL